MVLAYYGMIMSFLSGGFRIVTVQSLAEGMFKTDVLNARRSMSSAQAALSSSKGGGYGFAEKEHEQSTLAVIHFSGMIRGGEDISIIPVRENDEFIKSNVDDLVPILRTSEVTLILIYRLERINTLLIGDMEIDFNHLRDKPDLISRSIETSDLLLEELTAEFDLDDSIPIEIDDGYYNSEALFPKESSLLVPPLPDFKLTCLREVERFDPFFSLTQSGDMMRMMEIPFDGSLHVPLPRQVAYSPKTQKMPEDLNRARPEISSKPTRDPFDTSYVRALLEKLVQLHA
ncbi:hypothetical protein Tco_0958267 [Tanacetum coccineum]